MGAPSKRARKTRDASEFDTTRASTEAQSPRVSPSAYSWDLAAIVSARDAQMSGRFRLAARLAESMRTDDALHVAYGNRLAPQRCIKVELQPAKGSRGASIAIEAEALFGQEGVGLHPDTLRDVHGCLVNHGVAFANVIATPREDGSRVDYALKFWPIEFVRWDAYEKVFKTQVQDGFEEVITHGDGQWIIFQDGEVEPFKNGALLAAAMVWARHAFAIRDWAKGSVAHGSAKVIGEMPEGVALQKAGASGGSELTSEAAAMVSLLRSIASADAPVGIRPAGSKVDFLTNTSTAWQVWTELVANAEKAAARIYLGTDGTLGSNGGAPGVDIAALFGVSTTKVQGDLGALERAIQTGLIEVWCAVNFGDSSLAPSRRYMLPDADADAARESLATRTAAFYDEIDRARASGFAVSQEFADAAAARHGVEAPTLPLEAARAPTIALAPTDIARVVTVNEARAGSGLSPLLMSDGTLDLEGSLTLEKFGAPAPAPVAPASTPVSPPPLKIVPPPKPEVDHEAARRENLKAYADGNKALLERLETFSRRFAELDASKTAELQTLRESVAQVAEAYLSATEQSEERMTATLAELAAIRAAASAPPAVVELSFAERNAAYMNDLKDHRGAGLVCDQKRANELADLHGVPRGKVA